MISLEQQYSSLHWAYVYLSLPYKKGSDGPDSFDCWGLVRDVCKRHIDCEMPLLNIGRDDNQEAISEAVKGWEKIYPPYKEYDVLTMKGIGGRHIGICVEANGGLFLLHAEEPCVQLAELKNLGLLGYKNVQGWRYYGK